METIKAITNTMMPIEAPKMPEQGGANLSDEKKKKVAQDFESVLMTKVIDEMKDTIQRSELVEDDTSEQVDGLFWTFLAQDVTSKGPTGLWKQVYSQMNDNETGSKVDAKL
jgi:Rod binding domain-containing protein